MTTSTPTFSISAAQRQQFETDGFFVTPPLFDEAALGAVRGEFQRFWEEEIAAANQTGDAAKIHWAKVRLFVSQLDHRSEVCRAFCHEPVFGDICRQLIGPEADLAWNQAIVKAPMPDAAGNGEQNAFAWHQDPYYAIHGPFADDCNKEQMLNPNICITLWAAISRTTVDNGTLWVLPGRHKEGLLPHVWNEERREFQGQFDTALRIPVVLRPGQVLVFRNFLPHSSGKNVSQETRMAYQLSYCVSGLNRKASANFSPMLRGGELV